MIDEHCFHAEILRRIHRSIIRWGLIRCFIDRQDIYTNREISARRNIRSLTDGGIFTFVEEQTCTEFLEMSSFNGEKRSPTITHIHHDIPRVDRSSATHQCRDDRIRGKDITMRLTDLNGEKTECRLRSKETDGDLPVESPDLSL